MTTVDTARWPGAARRPRIPRDEWDRAPYNRWTFQNVREIVPTTEVWRGDGPVWRLPAQSRNLDGVEFSGSGGESTSVAAWLAASFSDGFIVLHRGALVYERYFNGMTERTLHLSQSMAKSVTAAVTGTLVGRGLLDPNALVTGYLPELEQTAWRGATLRHVLDMTSGVRFVEDYEALDSDIAMTDIASGWKAARGQCAAPACVWDQILGLKAKAREHGALFQYRSIETDVLAHCMERVTATRLAELVSEVLWRNLGAQENACFTVDAAGYAVADGGFNACLRDYARFGQMHLDGGLANGRRIVPYEWIADTRAADHGRFGEPYTAVLPRGGYRNQFWIEDCGKPAVMARGVFGQLIYINPDYDMVVVKLSSWPEFQSVERSSESLAAVHAIGRHLNNRD